MKKPVIIIPSYWTKGDLTKEDAVYDHPTDLLLPRETLSKTLKSLEIISDDFDTIVIGCPVRSNIGLEMDKAIIQIIRDANLSFTTKYFGYNEYNLLKTYIEKEFHLKDSKLISNTGYGNVRNLCLLLPQLFGYEVVILIDDDELVTDRLFVRRAIEFVGKKVRDKVLGLIVGFYKNLDDSIFIDETKIPWWRLVWEKEKLMNEAFQSVMDNHSERLVQTPFAFGGNMVIHKSCWEIVPFDPLIKRGEDMDYLRNVQYFGFTARLDKELFIVHDPPKVSENPEIKFKQDIHRFLYSQYKLKHMKINPSLFDPYPGYFLNQIEGKIILTEVLNYIYHNSEILFEITNINHFIDKIANIDLYLNQIQKECQELSGSYIIFQNRWKSLMKILGSLKAPKNIVLRI